MRATVAEILGRDGALSASLTNYEPRPTQIEMAEAVSEALRTRRYLLVEAGTGTGKTLAYLVPAILSGLKVVISTGTKHLQEQIVRKDIPILTEELGFQFSYAIVKGLSNYLCRRRYEEFMADERVVARYPAELRGKLQEWVAETTSGDRAELPFLADDAPIWRDVSPSPETRLGPRCPHYERCFVTEARRRAQGAQLVVVNHHLFFADLALKAAWPQAQLLPAYEAVVFDEAHQLEDIITDYFGIGISTLRMQALQRDVSRAISARALPDRIARINEHVTARADAMFERLRPRVKPGPTSDRTMMNEETWRGEPERAAFALDNALDELQSAIAGVTANESEDGTEQADILSARVQAIRNDLAALMEGAARTTTQHVHWAEQRGKTLLLHASPIAIDSIVREHVLGKVDAAIFTSATLSTSGNFEFVRSRLGLQSANELRVDSPFDYDKQALLYLPRDLPEPNAPDFIAKAAERMFELVEASDGRAFLLFTSNRNMHAAHELLWRRFADRAVFLQGEQPKHLLVEAFKQKRGSVLFATASFWEGVDVVGDALSLVVIDKLPFAPPDDPLLAARARALEENGHDAFMDYHVPRAALSLAQGFGRLIRHRGDRGVVALLDRRAVTKGYGKKLLSSLPADCPRTNELAAVQEFFARARA